MKTSTINKAEKVIDYLDKITNLPFYICSGDCEADNLKLVEVKNGTVEFEGKTYFYCWHGDKKMPKDGIAYAYIVNKAIDSFKGIGSSLEKMEKDLTKLFGEPIYPTFSVRDYVITDENYIPNMDEEIYIYPHNYDRGISLDYTQSSRSGLSIKSVNVTDLFDFMKIDFLPTSWGYHKPLLFLTKEFKQSFYGEGFEIPIVPIVPEINKLLEFEDRKYYIEDDDSYGDYSLKYIKLLDSSKINEIIVNHFKNYKGDKYMKSYSQISPK